MEEEALEYLKGTTTVGLSCEDGIVLATDTRASAGKEIASKEAKKLYKITDRMGVTVAGSVGDTQELVKNLRAESRYYKHREGAPIRIQAAAKMASNMFKGARVMPMLAVLILAGVDDKGPSLYLLNMDGSMIEENMVATGSGSPVAYGLLESEYEEGMELDEITSLAVDALQSAMERDTATGDGIRVANISEDKGFQELSSEEVQGLTS